MDEKYLVQYGAVQNYAIVFGDAVRDRIAT